MECTSQKSPTPIPHTEIGVPTKETYEQLQKAFHALNKSLFAGELPNCLITLQRKNRSYGYFAPKRFGRDDGTHIDEIALNPTYIRSRSLKEVLATLAHEMVHLWQFAHGKPGRGRYHNREWAEKMKEIGLQPFSIKDETKETGDSMHHKVITNGPFDKAANRLISRDFALTWTETVQKEVSKIEGESAEGEEEPKSGKRFKFTCPNEDCKETAWAKHSANLACGQHMVHMTRED